LQLNKDERQTLLKAVTLMRNFQPFWAVAGGWAIDLHLGRMTRHHSDIEIAVFRQDQLALQDYFKGCVLQKAVDGKLIKWKPAEFLELPVHEIHCYNDLAEPGQLEILLNETDKNDWLYRRNKSIRRQLDKCYLRTDTGFRYLAPEIVLLYKSKNPRDKDESDFRAAVKYLDAEQKEWLRTAIAICYSEHRWLENL
jgi:hypothetical protein